VKQTGRICSPYGTPVLEHMIILSLPRQLTEVTYTRCNCVYTDYIFSPPTHEVRPLLNYTTTQVLSKCSLPFLVHK